jgi:hypothetical protein
VSDQLGLDFTAGHVPQIEGVDPAVLQRAVDEVRRHDMTEEQLEHEVVCWLVGEDEWLWRLVQDAQEYDDDVDAVIRRYCADGHWDFREEVYGAPDDEGAS